MRRTGRGCVAGSRDTFDPTRLGGRRRSGSCFSPPSTTSSWLSETSIRFLSLFFSSTLIFVTFEALFNVAYSRGRWPATITPYTRHHPLAADRHSRPTTTTCTTRRSLSKPAALDSLLQRTRTTGVLLTICTFVTSHHPSVWLTTTLEQVRFLPGRVEA